MNEYLHSSLLHTPLQGDLVVRPTSNELTTAQEVSKCLNQVETSTLVAVFSRSKPFNQQDATKMEEGTIKNIPGTFVWTPDPLKLSRSLAGAWTVTIQDSSQTTLLEFILEVVAGCTWRGELSLAKEPMSW